MRSATIQFNLIQCCRLETYPQPQNTAPASVATPDLLWEHPPESLRFACGEIHLWRASLDQAVADLAQFSAILSEDESVRAARYRFEKDRRRFILRRSLLRMILSRYLEIEPALLQFTYGPCGKPALAYPHDDNLQFNLSHSEGLALYAVTRYGAIGVDVERVRVIKEAGQIAGRYFSPQETTEWRSLPRGQRPESFLRLWSRTEASLKVSGRGLFDVTEPIQSWRKTTALEATSSWPQCSAPRTEAVLYELTPATHYVGALALAVPGVVKA